MKSKAQRTLRFLCVAALLTALEIVLNRFCSINTAGLKIGFAFIPPILAAMLFGPGMSALVWGLSDFLGAIFFPIGVYHPGFTLCAVLMGLVAGFLLHPDPLHIETKQFVCRFHREKVRFFPHMVLAAAINCLLLGLFVNTIWVAMLSDKHTYWGWFSVRMLEYGIMVPVQLLLMPPLLKLTQMLRKTGFFPQISKAA